MVSLSGSARWVSSWVPTPCRSLFIASVSKLKSWSTKSSACRMLRVIKYATNRSEKAFPVEGKHHCLLAEVLSPSLRLRHTGDQQLSAAEVAERSPES
jgi:hypothetical protein